MKEIIYIIVLNHVVFYSCDNLKKIREEQPVSVEAEIVGFSA